ncbi:hypothetical protein AB5I41_14705 [Sphingomonas sp. MMS24-JH45]
MSDDGLSRSLGEDDLPLLRWHLAACPRRPSEYSLPNLLLYRQRHDYRIVVHGQSVLVLGTTYDGVRHAMPLGPIDDATVGLALEVADCLYPIEEEEATFLCSAHDLAMDASLADADYLYEACPACHAAGGQGQAVASGRVRSSAGTDLSSTEEAADAPRRS